MGVSIATLQCVNKQSALSTTMRKARENLSRNRDLKVVQRAPINRASVHMISVDFSSLSEKPHMLFKNRCKSFSLFALKNDGADVGQRCRVHNHASRWKDF